MHQYKNQFIAKYALARNNRIVFAYNNDLQQLNEGLVLTVNITSKLIDVQQKNDDSSSIVKDLNLADITLFTSANDDYTDPLQYERFDIGKQSRVRFAISNAAKFADGLSDDDREALAAYLNDNPVMKQAWAENYNGKTHNRATKDEYFLRIAEAVSSRSTCLRRQYGAVIVTTDNRIIATGYNGSAAGEPNCCDIGACLRKAKNIPHGANYELCVAIHAEDNALTQAGREARGAKMYLAGFENGKSIKAVPCMMCARKIKNSGIASIITWDDITTEN
jgi:dCMP deaminase